MTISQVSILLLLSLAIAREVRAHGISSSSSHRGSDQWVHHSPESIKRSINRRAQAGIDVPKLVGDWTRMIDFPVDTGESQGTMIGCDLLSVGGFFDDFATGPNITYLLDLCDPTAQWREMAELPLVPFLTHGAHAHKGDNLMYLCGGYLGKHAGRSITDCFVFDKTDGPKGSWTAIPSLPNRLGGGGMLYIESLDRLVFTLGAIRRRKHVDGVDVNSTYTLDLGTPGAKWQSRPGGAPYLGNHATAVTAKDCSGNTRYYFLGGQVGEREKDLNIDLVYEYMPLTEEFVQRQSMPEARGHFTTANWAYGCGFITVGGAIDGDPTVNTWSDDVLYYDIDSDTWTRIGTYPELIKTPVCGIVENTLYCANGYTVNSYQVDLSFGEDTSTEFDPVIIDTDFATNDFDGYQKDVFYGTNRPKYSRGWWSSSSQFLVVRLGGADDKAVAGAGISGGHTFSYTLTSDAFVMVEFRYKVTFESDFEDGEDIEVLCGVGETTFVVATFVGADSSMNTKWLTASVDLGMQSAGVAYEFALGGYLSAKNDILEVVRMQFDDVSITAAPMTPDPVLIQADFNTANTFEYIDDAFRDTDTGAYAQGWWLKDRFLVVRLGGGDDMMIQNMSGGHKTTFMIAQSADITVEFRYKVGYESTFEAGEDVEVLCSVGDVVTVVETLLGADDPTTTAWKTVNFVVAGQPAGSYDFIVGGFLLSKNEMVERVKIQVDDVLVSAKYL